MATESSCGRGPYVQLSSGGKVPLSGCAAGRLGLDAAGPNITLRVGDHATLADANGRYQQPTSDNPDVVAARRVGPLDDFVAVRPGTGVISVRAPRACRVALVAGLCPVLRVVVHPK